MYRATLLATLLLGGCEQTPVPEQNKVNPISTREPVGHEPDGAWIMTEFHDSILVHRRIGAYRRPAPVWTSLALIVDKDSIRRHGTLTERFTAPRSGKDTLLWADEHVKMFFTHDATSDVLTVNWGPGNIAGYFGKLHYRRLRAEEEPLLIAMNAIDRNTSFRQVYHTYLLCQLFAGRYDELEGSGPRFVVDAMGKVSEHQHWRDLAFHDYFGTLHPYKDDMDALWFTDAQGRQELFNWKFNGDTLQLTELIGNGDEYWLGKRRLRFLKR